jgi:replicative DNA helicase
METQLVPFSSPRPKGRAESPVVAAPQFTGRTAPHSVEAEEHLVGCIMLDGAEVMRECHKFKLCAESFYVAGNGLIFKVAEQLYRRGQPCDLACIAEELKAQRQLDTVGGFAGLSRLIGKAPTIAQAKYFARVVRDQWAMRGVIREFSAAVEACYGNTGGGEELASQLETKSAWIARALESLRSDAVTMGDAAGAALDRTLAKLDGKVDKSRWLFTGLREFDERFGALDANNEDWLVILGAFQAGGKSSLARQIVVNNLRQGKTAVLFLFETGLALWLENAACVVCGIDARSLDRLPADKRAKYETTLRELHGYVGKSLWIYDEHIPAELLVARMDNHARRLGAPDLIVVDHLHLMNAEQKFNKREAELGYISKLLARCFKRHNRTGLVLAQLNRSARSSGGNRRPEPHDVRDSGEIEQAARRMIFIHTPDKDMRGQDQDPNQAQVMVELVQAKHNNGRTGHREFWFKRNLTCFYDINDSELNTERAKAPPPEDPRGGRGRGAPVSKGGFRGESKGGRS